MKYIKKIKKVIKQKFAAMVYPDLIKLIEKEKKENKVPIWKFHMFGKNSFFWGEKHLITGYENIEIGENVHINNNAFIRGEGGLFIGDNTHISRNLVLYTINHDFKGGLIPYNNQLLKKPVTIGSNVWIGMNVCITPGTTIGEGCIIGMGTVVSGEIPPLTIIGSQKWRTIGVRDVGRYNYLVGNQMFGGIDGEYYNCSGSKGLYNEGDVCFSERSVTSVITMNGEKCIKKRFLQTETGLRAFQNEKQAYSKFRKYEWCPRLLSSGEDYIVLEYFDNKYRLDSLKEENNENLFKDIIWNLIDIFNSGFAHCDFHTKNIFITPEGIKITDFETIQPQDTNIDFFKSYDIIGKGLGSPFSTDNMCLFHQSKFSLANFFDIKSMKRLKEIIQEKFKNEALKTSTSFYSNLRNGKRAKLQVENIYSSFSLRNFIVTGEESQRNTMARFEKFCIYENDIKNKTVLDVGSNIGGILLGLTRYGLKTGIGLEIDVEKVNFSNKLARFNKINDVNFFKQDIEEENFIEEYDDKFQVVFCLAVLEHLKDKDSLFSFLSKVCLETLYLEGNENTSTSYVENKLFIAGFKDITFLGFSADEKNIGNNKRPMWKASRMYK